METERKNKAGMRNLATFLLVTRDDVPLTDKETATLLTEKVEEFPSELKEKLGRYLDPNWYYTQIK